jgi:hypothetical protein
MASDKDMRLWMSVLRDVEELAVELTEDGEGILRVVDGDVLIELSHPDARWFAKRLRELADELETLIETGGVFWGGIRRRPSDQEKGQD